MQNYCFDIYLDVSGSPTQKQYFALIAVNSNFSHNFEKGFDKRFPQLLKSKIKGTKLPPNKLSSILDFFDSNRAYFTSCPIRLEEWQQYAECYSNKAYWKERIYGITYYRLLQRTTKPKVSIRYNVILCEDNQLDTKKARNYLNRLLDSSGRTVKVSSGLKRDVPQLKFADFVASAHRKLGYNILKQYSHYKNCPPQIPPDLLDRTFTDRSSV